MQDKLEKILVKLAEIGLYPALGVEIEFYVIGEGYDDQVQELLTKIAEVTGLEIQQEKGFKQFEIASEVYNNIFNLIAFVQEIKETILKIGNNYPRTEVSFNPKPYLDDYGSGMHFHMSLLDGKGFNIFNVYDTLHENTDLLKVIGGILKTLNKSLYIITGDDDGEFARLRSSKMSPTKVSWGKNNRTTAIRIPDSSPFNRNRRIEFRVPSAQADPSKVVLFLLTAAFYGIKLGIVPQNCTYGDANEEDLEKIHSNSHDAKNSFCFWEIFELICKNT